jgi:hypothetical protein
MPSWSLGCQALAAREFINDNKAASTAIADLPIPLH